MIFTLRSGVKFWNGDPVTPADVVYSLDRQMLPSYGGFYGLVFNRVKSIAATGANQVTITLKQPDYWLEGELASMPGIIIQKSYAVKQGKNYGTPAGGIMCTGPYEFKSWTAGGGRHRRGEPALLERRSQAQGRPDRAQGRAGRGVVHLRHADWRDPGLVLLRPVQPEAAREEQHRARSTRAPASRRTRSSFPRRPGRWPTSRCGRRSPSPWTGRRSSTRSTTARR